MRVTHPPEKLLGIIAPHPLFRVYNVNNLNI